jgi:hypothetical protein
MTDMAFQSGMARLIETFGKAQYSSGRAKLIWREVEKQADSWFAQVVDLFIGTLRHPPLVPEFAEQASAERERLWKAEKLREANEASRFMHSIYQPDDVRMIIQQIIKRATGQMSDSDFSGLMEMLKSAPHPTNVVRLACRRCEDTGYIFETKIENDFPYQYVSYCTCAARKK